MTAVVETKSGQVEGAEKEGVTVFRGIPYAAPPIGRLRFRPPQPPEPWVGVRMCDRYGFVAPQPKADRAMAGQTDGEQSEDCLHLNVWTPGCDDARRPVMVWIHGGVFVSGSGSVVFYRGHHLARRGDVVVVTLNYRLGALGFLAHPDLRVDNGTPAGNWGLLDQVAALQWVQDNIAGFGGDPDNVTIFGESAGSMSVSALLGSPGAQGLFKRAIAQSGGPMAASLDAAAETAEELASALGVHGVAAIADVPVDALLGAQVMLQARRFAEGSGLVVCPVIDGALLEAHPHEAIGAGQAAGKELLVGSNSDEMKLWVIGRRDVTGGDEAYILEVLGRTMGEAAAAAYETYRAARAERGETTTPVDIWSAIESDRIFRLPSLQMAEAHGAAGSPAFNYLFSWPSPAMGGLLGACHTLEIPFVFGTLTLPGVGLFTGDGPDALALAEKMQDAWLAFARTGNPSTPSLGTWPQYDATRRATMVFGMQTAVAERPLETERTFWDEREVGRQPDA